MKKVSVFVRDIIATMFIVVDLFCGAGGTTTGFAMTNGLAKVIACVNHDKNAIKSHWLNNPEVKHFEEDIRTLDLTELINLVNHYRAIYKKAKVILWASLECTNFSKAKGGLPRDADSRTLADSLIRYIVDLNPDIIQIENVVEFMAWGPLDENGKPVSRRNGTEWMRWRKEISELGYFDEWRELNSADFGAYTSRNRLFGIFTKKLEWISWPEPTHCKNPSNGLMFEPLEKWKPVKDVLDFNDIGKSIFNRKKPVVDKTLNVIEKGLVKAIKTGESAFLIKYNGKSGLNSIVEPAGVITTKDRFALILRQYKTGYTSSIEQPIGSLPTVPKANIVSFIMNKSHGGHTTSVNSPSPVIVASQHKSPLYIIQTLMNENGIEDITMRMLKVSELLLIQGFDKDYRLVGTQADQKKFIGNSVVPIVVKAWTESLRGNIEKLAA
ncbi:MAG: DNA cytosine methyltransferase [Bacteroidia bacterium]